MLEISEHHVVYHLSTGYRKIHQTTKWTQLIFYAFMVDFSITKMMLTSIEVKNAGFMTLSREFKAAAVSCEEKLLKCCVMAM